MPFKNYTDFEWDCADACARALLSSSASDTVCQTSVHVYILPFHTEHCVCVRVSAVTLTLNSLGNEWQKNI